MEIRRFQPELCGDAEGGAPSQHWEECPVLLVSLKAGCCGLNLCGAQNVFLLDPWWNVRSELTLGISLFDN